MKAEHGSNPRPAASDAIAMRSSTAKRRSSVVDVDASGGVGWTPSGGPERPVGIAFATPYGFPSSVKAQMVQFHARPRA